MNSPGGWHPRRPQKSYAFAEKIAQARRMDELTQVKTAWTMKVWRIFGTNLGLGIAHLVVFWWGYLLGSWFMMAITLFAGITNLLIGMIDRQDRVIGAIVRDRPREETR